MRWIKYRSFLLVGLFCLFSCDLDMPEEVYDNPLDLDINAAQGISPPALIFNPSITNTTSGSNVTIQVFALEVNEVAGVHIQVQYSKNKLSVTNVSPGEFLQEGAQDPLFFYDNDPLTGLLDIYCTYLGDDTNVSGTGPVAYIIFSTTAPGEGILQYTNQSELVDTDDVKIQLNGLGQGVVNAQ